MAISEEIISIISEIKGNLKNEIGFYDQSSKAKIPFRLEVYITALSDRIIDHSEAILILYNQNKIIPAFGIIRSNFESLAVLNRITTSFTNSLEENKLDPELDNLLLSLTLGTREKENSIQAINVLTQLDKMDKQWKGIRFIYDSISEFVHPNCDGVIVSYSEIKTKLKSVQIKCQENSESTTAIAAYKFVPAQLKILHYFIDYITKNLRLFALICEDDIKSDPTIR
jgi:hypothetical protein